MTTPNQNPEQLARDRIDEMLRVCGWVVQSRKQINLRAGRGVAVREYATNFARADYVLAVKKKTVRLSGKKWHYEDHQPGLKHTTLTALDKTVEKNFRTGYLRNRQEKPSTPPNRHGVCG